MAKSIKRLSEKAEKEKLNKIVAVLPEDTRKIAEGLIDDAAFMLEQLCNLKDCIRKNGCVEDYKNGENQWGRKQSADFQAYISLQKSYVTTMKQLIDIVPKKASEDPGAELMEFIKS